MHIKCVRSLLLFGLSAPLLAGAQGAPQNGGDFSDNSPTKKLPTDVILVKGAWPSSSDFATPLPEGGRLADGVYKNQYFGLTYALPTDWTEKYTGPPPSDTGYYVLAQIRPADKFKGKSKGSILIVAQDTALAFPLEFVRGPDLRENVVAGVRRRWTGVFFRPIRG